MFRNTLDFVRSQSLFVKPYAFFVTGMKAVITAASDYFLGDIPEFFFTNNLLGKERSQNSEDGVGIVRLGPKFYSWNLVFISASNDKNVAPKQLTDVMNIDGYHARLPYNGFRIITESSFFLAIEGKEGMDLRKKVSEYFVPKIFYNESVELTLDFLNNELKEPMQTSLFSKKIELLLKQIIAKVLLGTKELPDNTTELFNAIESFIKENPLAIIIPSSLQFSKKARQLKKEYKKFVDDFLLKIKTKTPLLIEILAEKNIHKRDQNVRMLFAIFLAANNISSVVDYAIHAMHEHLLLDFEKNDPLDTFKKLLHMELQSNKNGFDEAMVRHKMPYLHALYLESLRLSDTIGSIVRYTHDSAKVNNSIIPPRSTIIYEIPKQKGNLDMDSYLFFPMRFIDSNDNIQLHQGLFTPFGLGARSCPAKNIAEAMFKGVLKLILTNVTIKVSKHTMETGLGTLVLQDEKHYVLKSNEIKPLNKSVDPLRVSAQNLFAMRQRENIKQNANTAEKNHTSPDSKL